MAEFDFKPSGGFRLTWFRVLALKPLPESLLLLI